MPEAPMSMKDFVDDLSEVARETIARASFETAYAMTTTHLVWMDEPAVRMFIRACRNECLSRRREVR